MDIKSFVIGFQKGKQSAPAAMPGLNIAFGDEPPEDTSKLWVKSAEPNNVTIQPNAEAFQYTDTLTVEAIATRGGKQAYACSAVIDDSIYFFCGIGETSSSRNSYVERFYKSGTRWLKEQITTSWSNSVHKACCASAGTLIYVFGGVDYASWNWKATNKIFVIDTVAKTVSTASVTLPSARASSCCATIGTKTYIFGGNSTMGAGGQLDTILCFDSEAVTVTTLEEKLPERIQMPFCCAVGSKIYIFGGHGYDSGLLNTIYFFDGETETLEQLGQTLPVPLVYSACTAIGENIYIFGGATTTDYTPSYDIYRFNTRTHKIYKCKSTMSAGPIGASAGTSANGTLLFAGSEYKSSLPCVQNAVDTVEAFVGSTDFSLDEGALKIITSETKNVFPVTKEDGVQVEIGVDSIFKGDTNNQAEPIEAALYKDGAWVTI